MKKKELAKLLREFENLPEYLEEAPITISTKSLFGNYPLNIAAARGSVEEISLLLDAGANINKKGDGGYTPLHDAVEQNQFEAVKFLIEKGAHADLLNEDGVDVIELCELLGHTELQNYLESALKK